MPSCFFLLMRFFLRVDGVLSRIHDTRLYHEFDSDYLIREYTEKEKKFSEIRVSSFTFFFFFNALYDAKLFFIFA